MIKPQITILALGTRGDVQPLLALGLGLRKAGFGIRVVVDDYYREFVERHGVEVVPITGVETMFSEHKVPDKIEECRRACDGAGAIVFSPHPFSFIGFHIAEKMNIPCFWAASFPMHELEHMDARLLPGRNIYGFYNPSFHFIVNHWRETILRLQPMPPYPAVIPWDWVCDREIPFLYFFSESILAKPAYWPSSAHITGFWFLDKVIEWDAPSSLSDFLAAKKPCLYFGFGSVFESMPDALFDLIERTLSRCNMNGVLQTGSIENGFKRLTDNVYLTGPAPHDWLFPRMSAIVHHGGLNTTGVALRAGSPSIIVPFMTDGPLWGRLLHEIGAIPAPIPHHALTVDKLYGAIETALTNRDMRANVERLHGAVNGEDGVKNAVDIIEKHVTFS